MEADQISELIQKCFSEGRKEDWHILGEELEKEENSLLREEFLRFGRLKQEDLRVDGVKMWEEICKYRKTGDGRLRLVRRILRYAAIIAIPLMIGGVILWSNHLRETWAPESVVASLEPGQSKAFLKLSNGDLIDLSAISQDTVFEHDGVVVRRDSSKSISYQFQGGEPLEVAYHTIVVPRAGEYRLVLADGSVVWLNSDSELRYPVAFSGGQRKVVLKGEAYFEVAKNADHSFVVEVEGMEVKVLGTRFNINAYREDGIVQTTLVQGRVEVSGLRCAESVILIPDQQAEMKNGHLTVREVDASVYTAWMQGKFYFESEPLEEIAAQLERWYDIQFFFMQESLKLEEFTGVIRRDYTAEQILNMITKTTNVKFDIKGRTVTVK